MAEQRPTAPDEAFTQESAINAWQIQRIKEGITAAREGRVRPAEEVFSDIARKHGWRL